MQMRKLLPILAVVLFGTSALLAEGKDEGTCTLGTLKGVYIFNASGFAPNLVPKAVVEKLTMPGDGTITVLGTVSVGGNVISNNGASTGTYTVNEDCSGTLAFSGGQHFNIYIAPSGKEFHMNQVDAGHVLAGKVTRVGP
jgi:hypothetical protein